MYRENGQSNCLRGVSNGFLRQMRITFIIKDAKECTDDI
jgi:hypothetical protein